MATTPLTNMTPADRAKYFAETVRFQDGKQYNNVNGQWVEVPMGTPIAPPRGSGSNVSFNGGGGTPGSGVGVKLPLFGAGGERTPIAGSGLPPVTFRPPAQTPAAGASGPGGAGALPVSPPGTLPPLGPSADLGTPPADPNQAVFRTTTTATPPTTGDRQTTGTGTGGGVGTGTGTGAGTGAGRGAGTGQGQGTGTGTGIMDTIEALIKKYGPAAKNIAAAVAALSSGRQAGRTAESNAAFGANQQNTARFLAELNLNNQDLLQRRFLNENYEQQRKNAIRGGYFQGVEDINIPRPEGVSSRNITGGLRPSAFQNRKEVGALMEKEAMTELLDPMRVASDPRSGTRRLPALPTAPEMLEAPGPNTFDSILQGLGYGLTGAGILDELLKANTPTPQTPTYKDLPISAPNPLVVQAPNINLGDAPLDPNGSLLDTLKRNRTGAGNYWGTGGYLPTL